MIVVEVVVAEVVAEVQIITTAEDETVMQRAVEVAGGDAATIAVLVEGEEMVVVGDRLEEVELEAGDAVVVVEAIVAVLVVEIIAIVIKHKMNLTEFEV
jgi:hypothetical protein